MNRYEPAFPTHGSMGEVVELGMTLGDYFAAMAMQALIAKAPFGIEELDATEKQQRCADGAYAYADAMLKARQS